MLAYLKKFNDLPAELKEEVSSQAALAIIEELEKKYQLPLAALIMKVMVKEIALADLAAVLLKENLAETAAGRLAEELKERIFYFLGDNLNGALRRDAPRRVSTKGASFFFSPDDEREIRELAKKIDWVGKTELPAGTIEEKLKAIIRRAQINFGSADLADRFKQILKTYFRGIRNKLETELTLTKPFLSGGLSFDEASAQKVMALADKIVNPVKSGEAGAKLFNGLSAEPGQTVKSLPKILEPGQAVAAQSALARDAPYDFSKLAKAETVAGQPKAESLKQSDQPRLEDIEHELAPLTPVRLSDLSLTAGRRPAGGQTATAVKPQPAAPAVRAMDKQAQEKSPRQAAENKIEPLSRQAGDTNQMPLVRLRFQAENLKVSPKVKVEDVKYVPRVMSPLDEIKYLDLTGFRRLDKDPAKATLKIRSKIDLLAEEGYGKKLEGIKLWRTSPVSKLYLAIGQLSISENKPIDVIIEERKIKGGDYLTAAEFKAIMDLNKSLRF